MQEVTAKIQEQYANFVRYYANGHADSLRMVFAENIKQYLPHQEPIIGLDDLVEKNRLLMIWGKWKFEFKMEEIKKTGPLAIERGNYKLTFTPNESSPIPASVDTGNYIALWEEIDGKWKLVWDAPVTEIPL